MKVGVILFHKDIHKIYKRTWIDKCLKSLLSQTYTDFDFLELNYGIENKTSILSDYDVTQKKYFWYKPMKNHCFAMNYLLDKAFVEMGYDYIFNVNMDDYYADTRIEETLKLLANEFYDVVSCNFKHIQEKNGEDVDVFFCNVHKQGYNQDRIKDTIINRNVNLIAHPAVCFNKTFWRCFKEIYYYDEIPKEDLELWKRSLKRNLKFKIINKVLLYYRKHSNQITRGRR